jgi:hypothetical protein
MGRARWLASMGWALAGPLLGVALAGLLGIAAQDERRRDLLAYAIATMPLAALLAGVAAKRTGDGLDLGRSLTGALLAVSFGLLTAAVLATVRFRSLGSTGLISLTALPFTREGLMVVGILPALAIAGGRAARRDGWGLRFGLLGSIGIGIAGSLLAGPMLILSSLIGRLPLLSPPVVTLLAVALLGWVNRARS